MEITVDLNNMRGVKVSQVVSIDDQPRALIHIELGIDDDLFIFGTTADFVTLLNAVAVQVDEIRQSHVDPVAEVTAALDGEEEV